MSSMVEKVAKAIAEGRGVGEGQWRHFVPSARAAMEAMREPTDEMVSAAEEADEHATDANLNEGGPGRGLYSDGIWRAMITAAR